MTRRGRGLALGVLGILAAAGGPRSAAATPGPETAVAARVAVVRPAPTDGRMSPASPRSVPRRVPGGPGGDGRTGPVATPPAAVPPETGDSPAPRLAAPLRSFEGLRRSESGGFVPPDTQVAAGPSHVVEVVNTAVRVFSRTGTPLLTALLQSFLGLSGSDFVFDPRIRFDGLSGRWFLSAATDDGDFGQWRLAVSATEDPLGPFFVYEFPTPGSLPDFPALGIGSDVVVLTANAFACSPSCDAAENYQGSELLVLDKAALLAGLLAVPVQFFPPDQGLFALQPAHALTPTPTMFMVGVDFGTATAVRLFRLAGVPGVGPGVELTTADLPIRPLTTPPRAAQAGSAILLDAGDNRLLDAVFRDGRLWTGGSAACVPPGDVATRSCLRLLEVETTGPTLLQDLDGGVAGTHAYYPAVHTDESGNLVVVYSRSSPGEFASVYVTGRFAADPPGTLQPPVLIKAGEAPYTPGSDTFNRWGDYSGAALDPTDHGSIWVAGEYARAEGGLEWGTWIAQVQLTPFPGEVFVAAGNLDGAGLAEIVTGPGSGGEPRVRTFTATGAGPLLDILAYPPGTGGVRVAACDLTGDGRDEIVTAPGPGFPPRLRAFDGATGAFLGELAVGPDSYLGGVFVACADLTGDGHAEVIATADAGIPPLGVVWQVAPGPPVLLAAGTVFQDTFLGGVRVAACDLNGDGRAEVVVGSGPGGPPRVRVLDGATGALLADVLGGDPGDAGGLFVGCGPVGPGGSPAIVTGRGSGGAPEVRLLSADGTTLAGPFAVYDPGFSGGVRVGAGRLSGGVAADVLVGPGPGGGPVRVFTGTGVPTPTSFPAY